ncbi:MAG: hypothetical protein GXO47_04935 [Chlorobi bacterium]|nr:hypothetical protein [Chlorobiota bacterium]
MKRKKLLFSLILLLSTSAIMAGDNDEKSPFNISADLVNRYIFRGLDFGSSPAIQPSLEFSTSNFTIGAWGSYSFVATPTGIEADLFAYYDFDFGLSLGVSDYYFPGEELKISDDIIAPERTGNYFNYSDYHYFEINANQTVGNFHLSANYGAVNLDNAIYVEAGYEFKWFDLFAGAGNKLYTLSGDLNLVNIGISATKEIEITSEYSISLSSSLILNPNAEQIHLVFCLGL